MAAKEVIGSLINELTDSVLHKYGTFLNDFDSKLDELHKTNLKYTYSSIDYGAYFNPGLNETVHERTEFVNLLQTCGNMELNRVLLVLSSLCHEMNNLSQLGLQEFINILVLYGEDKKKIWKDELLGGLKMSKVESGEELSSMANLLPILFKLLCYIRRCCDVVHNLTIQMQELFTKNGKRLSNKSRVEVSDVRFDALFQYLGQLAVTVINIEEVICNQVTLRKNFVNYKRTFEIVTAKYDDFNLESSDHQKMKVLHALTKQIEKEIIDGNIFRQLVDAIVNASPSDSSNNHNTICDQLALYIKNAVQFHEGDTNPIKDDKKWLAINALLVIYVRLSKRDDRKLIKLVFDSQKKMNSLYVHLKGNCTVFPDKFLAKHLSKSRVDKKTIEHLKQVRDNSLRLNLLEKVKTLNIRINIWMVQFDDLLSDIEDSTNDFIAALHKQCKVIEEGLELALQCSSLAKNHIYQHLYANKSMAKTDLIAICKLVTMLKGIELSFTRKKGEILQILARSTQYHSYLILGALTSCKKRLISEVKKYSEKKLDVLSAIILGSNCIHGPIMIKERQILASLCFSIANQSMSESELSKVYSGFKKIRSYSLIFQRLQDWTNCDFMFFNRAVIGIYFSHCVETDLDNIYELRYFFQSLTDFVPLVENAFVYDDKRKSDLIKSLEEEVVNSFRINYLERLFVLVETQLRQQVSSNDYLEISEGLLNTTGNGSNNNPFKVSSPNLTVIVNTEPFRILTRLISIKELIEQYLNELAYNSTTDALHDCKTYEAMLNLARHKYRLEFVESQLPTQTLEQGLDVLEITRNIHIFVSRYLYNLNNQMFIEKSSDNHHLNVLLIRHVANSIQTHGFGIINTAVNFTYQYLKRKLYNVSQFLFEDPIKSRLIKDAKHFRQSKDGKFPYERAEALVKGVRKLGLTSEGYTLLDRFRLLITEIGNALGFVRMLRSGALHCSSASISFIPDLEELNSISFKSMVLEDGFGSECLKSAENLDNILKTLNRNFTEATDYYSLLVQVFQGTLKDKDNFHLKKFFIILPALTLNYVENSIISKEKMTRKNNSGAALSDDGFPMGVAYILKLLDQTHDFDSLQWFSSVHDNIKKEMAQAVAARSEQNSSPLSPDDKLSQTLKLTEKRLDMLQKEFNLLDYNLTSSRILFKAANQETSD